MKNLLVLVFVIAVLICAIGCADQNVSTPSETSTDVEFTSSETTASQYTTTTTAPSDTTTTDIPSGTTTSPQTTTEYPEVESPYIYSDFSPSEKADYQNYVGFVIPFFQNNEYSVEAYNEDGYIGVYFSALCDSQKRFTNYLSEFNQYQNDDTTTDDYGDVWYLFSQGEVFIDVCYYEYDGCYYVDVDTYIFNDEPGSDLPNDTPSYSEPDTLLSNQGAGLPSDNGQGIHTVDFTKAAKVKNVTDQGNYLDGCPTVSSPDVLVIPVEFSDITAKSKGYKIDVIKEAFKQNGDTDYYSVYDYFYQSSYGKLTLDVTVLDSWFRPAKTSAYYASQTIDYYGEEVAIGDQMILDEALAYLESRMDLSAFDSDHNGIIDSVVLITTLDINEDSTFYWSFRYWNIYTDSQGYYYEYDGVSANDYVWAPYQTLHESYDINGDVTYRDTNVLNTYTLIHEFSHVLGADDYYDTTYETDPMQGLDMMDATSGDHNPYTKFNYGWITSSKLIVTQTTVTVNLYDFSQNGDTVILATNWDDSLGIYQEYYVLMYYTNTGLNGGDYGYFEQSGIVVYHINATLYYEEYEDVTYYDVYNNNTSVSDPYGTKDNLIEFVTTHSGAYVFTKGDSLGEVKDDYGNTLPYTFTVSNQTNDYATLTFTKK